LGDVPLILSTNRPFGVPALAGPGRLKAGHRTDAPTQTGFIVRMHAQNGKGAFHGPGR